MTEPPAGWSSPSGPDAGEPQPVGYGSPPQWGGGQPQAGQWSAPGTSWYGGPPPALQPGVVPLRPLALGELLDGAIKIIRRYPRPTLGLSAAISVVVTVINVLLILLLDPTSSTVTTSSSDGSSTTTDTTGSTYFGGGSFSTAPGTIVSYLAGIVLTGALVAVVGKAVLGQPAPTSEVWATVRPRLWALLGLTLLTGLIVGVPVAVGVLLAVLIGATLGVAGLLLAIPLGAASAALGVYLYVKISLAGPALVLEKAGIVTSLRRSAVLVRRSWWRVCGILLLAGVISSVLGAVISIPISLLGLLSSSSGGDSTVRWFLIANQVGVGLAAVLVSPFSAGVRALLYVDRRMRAEGLDVGLQAAATAGPPA